MTISIKAIDKRADEFQMILNTSNDNPLDTLALITLAARLVVDRARKGKGFGANLELGISMVAQYFITTAGVEASK